MAISHVSAAQPPNRADLDTAADALDMRFSVTNAAPVRPDTNATVIRINQNLR